MRQSELFARTRREAPKDEASRNAELLIQAGFVNKESSGVYSYLPLGLLVLRRIEAVVRQELTSLGAIEMLMPALQTKDNWQATGRWDTFTDVYKLKDSSGKDFILGPTHEEVITPLLKNFLSSYHDLPISVYQFQTKFRDEKRAKSGLLRGREFVMKDLYSFHRTPADLDQFYARVANSYRNVFEQLGLGRYTYLTLASGGAFAPHSEEFQVITPAGEDTIHVCDNCRLAINSEIVNEVSECSGCHTPVAKLRVERAIEVGNIFKLKTRFTEAFDLCYKSESGQLERPVMGCYGLGITRTLGVLAEVLSDDGGLVWPEAVTPFDLHLLILGPENADVRAAGDKLYSDLGAAGWRVLYDDRAVSAGEKFADADLIGLPRRLVMSAKTLTTGQVEVKQRSSREVQLMFPSELLGR
ncbi:MAG: aminoacyl--tRNA ligase-related protein [Patescibacteria group bacterium]